MEGPRLDFPERCWRCAGHHPDAHTALHLKLPPRASLTHRPRAGRFGHFSSHYLCNPGTGHVLLLPPCSWLICQLCEFRGREEICSRSWALHGPTVGTPAPLQEGLTVCVGCVTLSFQVAHHPSMEGASGHHPGSAGGSDTPRGPCHFAGGSAQQPRRSRSQAQTILQSRLSVPPRIKCSRGTQDTPLPGYFALGLCPHRGMQ